jgi:fimbrial isopeptide formation D2 family protein/LPXTG-motif cell wall-anchored protein
MDPGYYLVVDNTDLDSLSVNEADAITAYKVRNIAMVRVTENGKLTISNKTSVPSVEKKVKEKNDSAATDAQESGWQDGADYDIGDEVPFQLTATLPTNYADYDRYKLAFHDILSSGLTFKEITTVYALNGTNKTEFAVSDWSKGDGADGDSFAVTFADLKTSSIKDNISDSTKIVVEYTATLNESAVIGATGNPNKVYLEYANNPNNSGTGDIDTSNTPEDKVIVFTYQLKVNKVDEADEALQGAGFTLYKKNGSGTYDLVKAITNDDDIATEFIFTGLDAGSYKLVESKTPAGYNTAEDLLFVVSATYNTSADDPKLSSLTVDNTSLLTDMSTGIITTDVENKAGGTLPTTGGMGTTLFTVCGIVLMLGASILLVTRKRMSK